MRKTKIGNKSKEDWILDILKVIVLSIVTIITVYPFWNIFIISINDATDAIRGGLYFLPRKLSFSSYLEILTKKTFLSSIKVSVARTVIGTPIAVLVTSMLAYALSRRDLVGRKFWNLLFIFTMYFGGGLVPYYMVLKGIHMLNTFWVFIFPLMMSVYNMILVRSYVESMPESLFEAAKIDGATDLTVFFRLVLPLSKPILMTIGLFVAVNQWNSWFDNMIYCRRSSSLTTLQYLLRRMLDSLNRTPDTPYEIEAMGELVDMNPETVKAATTVLVVLPIILVYPFLQKYFVKGIMVGAVKG